ncbi:MAG: single-stranded-DNA-specific exonuclease RecJ [Chitinophagales bacterium]|nr:single-stranded-DNA-specific exonuclease RecJ [Chitinophagales bacterium]MDW8393642.1 single-stranded-DNA-specific exonuclease RecJ [Chitinophagales bacterium]
MRRRWNLIQTDPQQVADLTAATKLDDLIARLLVQRGITTEAEARRFFKPSLDQLPDPMLMADMDKAVHRLLQARNGQQPVLVYGDYDVDGTTAVAMVFSFLKSQGFHCDYYVPNRYTEGYGISQQGINYAHNNGIRLIVALDCGIKSHKMVAEAAQAGIDFIVCDHHLPDAEIPPAVAVLDPKRTDCRYPYKELSGCGIGFKLVSALARQLGRRYADVNTYLDLVAVSIAADIVPVTGENRVLAYYGLKKINENPRPGLKALSVVSGLRREITFNDLVFVIGPRINAAGRMDDARKAIRLLLEEGSQAEELAHQLDRLNDIRREHDLNITQQALNMLEQQPELQERKTTVLFDAGWHKGVIGIVASRLQDYYFRPTVILTESNGLLSGSARSVPGFDLYEAIDACRDVLVEYGGHTFAAGLKLLPENLELFVRRFEEVVADTIKEDQLIPELNISAEIHLSSINPSLWNLLKRFAPHGPQNQRPLFVTNGVTDTGWSRVVKEKDLKVNLKKDRCTVTGIGFGMADQLPRIRQGLPFSICYTVHENEWNGEKRLEIKLKDLLWNE